MGTGHLHDLGDLCGRLGEKDGLGQVFFHIGIVSITEKVFFRSQDSLFAQNGFKLMQDLLGQHGNILSCLEVFEVII